MRDIIRMKMFGLDEGKIECAVGDVFLAGQEGQDCFDFIYDIGIRGIYFLGSWFCQIQTTRLIMFFQPRSKSTPSVGLNLNLLCRSQRRCTLSYGASTIGC